MDLAGDRITPPELTRLADTMSQQGKPTCNSCMGGWPAEARPV